MCAATGGGAAISVVLVRGGSERMTAGAGWVELFLTASAMRLCSTTDFSMRSSIARMPRRRRCQWLFSVSMICSAGTMRTDEPPGMTALSGNSGRSIPPPSSWISSIIGRPSGAS